METPGTRRRHGNGGPAYCAACEAHWAFSRSAAIGAVLACGLPSPRGMPMPQALAIQLPPAVAAAPAATPPAPDNTPAAPAGLFATALLQARAGGAGGFDPTLVLPSETAPARMAATIQPANSKTRTPADAQQPTSPAKTRASDMLTAAVLMNSPTPTYQDHLAAAETVPQVPAAPVSILLGDVQHQAPAPDAGMLQPALPIDVRSGPTPALQPAPRDVSATAP